MSHPDGFHIDGQPWQADCRICNPYPVYATQRQVANGGSGSQAHTHSDYASTGHTHQAAAHDHDSSYAATGHAHDLTHSHTAAQVGAATSGHNHDGSYAAVHSGHAHSHTAGDVGAAATSHSHVDGDLPAGLARDAEVAAAYSTLAHTHAYAATSHAHAIADTTGLQTALDGKATSAHSHADADLPAGLARDAEVTSAIATHAATPHGASAPVHTVLANDTTALALATNTSVRLTVTANRTLTTTVPAAGSTRVVLILTSGTSSFTITFGTGFKPTGTLATGTTTARVFAVSFISDGTNLYETARTVAMVA